VWRLESSSQAWLLELAPKAVESNPSGGIGIFIVVACASASIDFFTSFASWTEIDHALILLETLAQLLSNIAHDHFANPILRRWGF
jgi:hypothetical protein